MFPLLEFLQVQGVYPEREILAAKIEALAKTNMVDFAMDIHASLHGPNVPCQGTAVARRRRRRARARLTRPRRLRRAG